MAILCFFLVGYLLGYLSGKAANHYEEKVPSKYIFIEKHPEGFFAYNYHNKKFLNKNESYQDLISDLKLQFKDMLLYIVENKESENDKSI